MWNLFAGKESSGTLSGAYAELARAQKRVLAHEGGHGHSPSYARDKAMLRGASNYARSGRTEDFGFFDLSGGLETTARRTSRWSTDQKGWLYTRYEDGVMGVIAPPDPARVEMPQLSLLLVARDGKRLHQGAHANIEQCMAASDQVWMGMHNRARVSTCG